MDPSKNSEALIITPYYLPELIGSGPYCADIAEALAARGISIKVFTARPHYPTNVVHSLYSDGFRDSEIYNGIPVERVNPFVAPESSSMRRMISEALFLIQGLLAISFGRVRRQKTVVSLCPSILAVLLGVFATRRSGRHTAVVHDIQSGLANGLSMVGNSRLIAAIRWVERSVLNRVDLVIVPSSEMKTELQKLGVKVDIDVIPIWVDTNRFRPLEKSVNERLTVMYSGNLGRKQALSQIVELASSLSERQSRIQIVLRGEGSQSARLARDAADRGLTNIDFQPLLPAEEANRGLADGDIHLVPQDPNSVDFAIPSKVYTIMAAARPFVATADGKSALKRLEELTRGFICVPPDDTAALTDAVLALAADESLRRDLGARGRHYVVENHSREKVLRDLCKAVGCGT